MPSCDTNSGVCQMQNFDKILAFNFTKPTIVYVGDPMCSWCYGIAKELERLREFTLENGIDFKIMLGGLRPNAQEWNDEFKAFLAHHWQEVSKKSDQVFDYEFLKRESFSYSTLPGCKAVVLMRNFFEHVNQSEKTLSYFSDIQKAFFAKNIDPTDTEVLANIAQNYGIKKEIFIENFNEKYLENTTFAEFSQVQSLGVRGFPSVILFDDENPTFIAQGYAKSEKMIEKIKLTCKQT